VGGNLDLGFSEHDVEGEFGATAEMEFVPDPPVFLLRKWGWTAMDAGEGDVGVALRENEKRAGGIEDKSKFLIAPAALEDLRIVKAEFVKGDRGWWKTRTDKAEIPFVEFTVALDLGAGCSRPAGSILAADIEFASEEEHSFFSIDYLPVY